VQHPLPIDYPHGAVLDPDGRGPAEEALHLFGPGRGGEVVVRVRIAEQRVAQGAAHAPGLVPRLFERAGDLEHRLGNVELRRKAHVEPYDTPAESAMVNSIRAWDGVRGPAGMAPIAVVRAPPPSKAYVGTTMP
jgi:hypothetical protein